MKTNVYKLGGDFFTPRVIKIFFMFFLTEHKEKSVLFVVSAMKGITRLLRLIVQDKVEKDVDDEFIELRTRLALNEFHRVHMNLVSELFSGEHKKKSVIDFENIFEKLKKTIDAHRDGDDGDKFYAEVLKFGELASSNILSNYITFLGAKNTLFDARDYVVGKGFNLFKEAEIERVEKGFEKFFQRSKILVTQGFIGRNIKGQDVVLGFDGSDYSAAKFANVLVGDDQDVSLTLWKRVRGVFEKDPTKHNDAIFISDLTRKDYIQNVKNNSTYVIRPDSVSELDIRIDIHVRSFEEEYLNDIGTLIHS